MKLSIGQVSKLYDISLDTLRHYDKIGLLKPEINPKNGYRYYSFQHMDQLGLILATKELGISLSDIKNIIKSEDINEYKNLILRQEQLIKEKIKQLEKLQKRIEENKGIFDTIIGFENEYDFSKLNINKNEYTFYCIDLKQLIVGDFFKNYLRNLYDLQDEKNENPCLIELTKECNINNVKQEEEYFYIYEIKDNEEIIENENLLCIKENYLNKCILDKMKSEYDINIVEKKLNKNIVSVSFYGTLNKLKEYLRLLYKYFECDKNTKIFVKYEFYLPKKLEYEEYFTEIILEIK